MLTDNINSPLILVVEDDSSHALLIERSLDDSPFEFRLKRAANVSSAKAAIGLQPPALILSDYRLPDGHGSELVTLASGACPVIIMTSHGSEKIAVEAMKVGAQDYIVKSPEAFDDLPRTVSQGLKVWSLILARRQADQAVIRAKSDWERTFDALPDLISIIDTDHTIIRVNRAMAERCGLTVNQIVGRKCYEVVHGLSSAPCPCPSSEMIRDGQVHRDEIEEKRLDGYFDVTVSPLFDEQGLLTSFVHVMRDKTEQKRSEEVLRESEERFSTAFSNAPIMISISSIEDGTYLDVNRRFLDVSGFSRDEVIGRRSVEIGWVAEEDRNRLKEAMIRDGRIDGMELGLRTKSGRPLVCSFWGEMITLSGQKRLLSIALDITEQRNIERQFIQAQKMESVGRLAGGVAHDFNNMLGIIIGRSELTLMKHDLPPPVRNDLLEILAAAERSADITRQLLAFSRQQAVQPKVIDLNDAVSGTIKMLRRLIGEDIELIWNPGYGVWKVRMDQAQVDQILANLCINARDAISGIGRIMIQTDNVVLDAGHDGAAAGDYVMLAVSDSGAGMDAEILEHIFEPFYTTKDLGHGTGLGLATVYGIVKQNGGRIEVSSEPLNGTVFRIYLPAENDVPADPAADAPSLVGGAETILVVEDEPVILHMTTDMLTNLGYTVFAATTAENARRIADENPSGINLLITDVIMPGMNGHTLARHLLESNPGMKCLYMSGYTADVIADRGKMDDKVHFLQKPFNLQTLSEKVREVLGCG